MTLYKVFNKNMIHYDHHYKEGLNILQGEFNDDPEDECGKGGFYFTTSKHLLNYVHGNGIIREIELPVNDPEFKVVHFKTNLEQIKLLLEKYAMLSIYIWIKHKTKSIYLNIMLLILFFQMKILYYLINIRIYYLAMSIFAYILKKH